MKFVHNFDILVIFFTKIIWIVVSEGNFGAVELTYLSNKLSPIECLKLLERINFKTPLLEEEYLQSNTKILLKNESILRRQLEIPFFNRDNCYDKLEEWSQHLPQRSHQLARTTMETELRNLGRPDLAKYVRKSRRVVRYFDDFPKSSKKVETQASSVPQKMKKKVHVVKPVDMMKTSHKVNALQYYPFGSINPARAHANFASRESADVHQETHHKSETDDMSTRWTAFLVLLGVIVLTILSTVIFALYKKNRGTLCTKEKKCTSDRCPLADRYRSSHCVVNMDNNDNKDDDDEDGDKNAGVRCARRKDTERLSDESFRSPLPMYCIGGKNSPARKPKTNKSPKAKFQREAAVEKSIKRGRSKKRSPKCVKQTKTKDLKMTEKSKPLENQAPKPRLELKTFQAKIASILRKDNPPCKCCKCIFRSDKASEVLKCFGTKTKEVCEDKNCQKTRMKNITDLCFSPDSSFPSDEYNKIEKKQIKQKKKRKKKKPRKDKDDDRDSSKEKEFYKSSARNSARSRDKNACKIKKKPTKEKKERYNVEEACTRKTCGFSNIEETSNFQ